MAERMTGAPGPQRMMPAYDPAKVHARVRTRVVEKTRRVVTAGLETALGAKVPRWLKRELARRGVGPEKHRAPAEERGRDGQWFECFALTGRLGDEMRLEMMCFGLDVRELEYERFRARWQHNPGVRGVGCRVRHRPSGVCVEASHFTDFRANRMLAERELYRTLARRMNLSLPMIQAEMSKKEHRRQVRQQRAAKSLHGLRVLLGGSK